MIIIEMALTSLPQNRQHRQQLSSGQEVVTYLVHCIDCGRLLEVKPGKTITCICGACLQYEQTHDPALN